MLQNKEKKWTGKSRGGQFGHWVFVKLLKTFGVRAAYFLLALIVPYFIPFAPKSSKGLWLYYRRRWGYGRWQTALAIYKHYYRFGQTLIDRVAMRMGLKEEFSFTFDGLERMLEVINGDSGVLIIGAHIGCWEMGSAFFGDYGKKINIVMYDSEYQKIKKVIEREQNNNYKVIPVGEDNITTMLSIKKALMDKEYVCFQGDRYFTADNTLEVQILDKEAQLPQGPFLIASKMKVPVVFYFALREAGMKYRFVFKDIAYSKDLTAEGLALSYTEEVNSILKSYKEQWFNLYNYWEE